MDASQPSPRAKGGRPPKYIGDERSAHTIRLRKKIREALAHDAQAHGRSLSEEIETRLEQLLEGGELLRGFLGVGPMPSMFRAVHQIFSRLQRIAGKLQPDRMGAERYDRELNTRREMRAAVAVVTDAYLATEVLLPPEPRPSMERQGEPWGSGQRGREAAFAWLEWEGDEYLDGAKGTAVYDDWTGEGRERLGDLVEAGAMTKEEATARRFPEGEPKPLSDVMARNDDGSWKNPVGKTEPDQPPQKTRRTPKNRD